MSINPALTLVRKNRSFQGEWVPVVYYLSGLTCSDLNVTEKAGYQRVASALGLAIACPDTSPRGAGIPGEQDEWDFGVGAGYYVDATQDPWKKNYKMYTYVTSEFPALLGESFQQIDTNNCSVMGHSVGGHGSLTVALKNPGKYKSASAFAPACNLSETPWGFKAFGRFFGDDDKSKWKQHDACCLAQKYAGPALDVKIDVGFEDFVYVNAPVDQLRCRQFRDVAAGNPNVHLDFNERPGYDHSYFFVATFMEDHLKFHAEHLKN
ncbi:hypothetical protein FOZ63_008245 [Perkinsus olseni]|uniref:S-formylglutathione hydrolase n=1 Tax=Perkinsus olseni TaxID=32597 RepID=A0A7J6SUH2_PEROL|nr:hypothetical protein FOZ63_008245 [Perkinsus olseni]KAF4740309.1 hypothetical protein FOZ62_009279 [Perkinsus olseni]